MSKKVLIKRQETRKFRTPGKKNKQIRETISKCNSLFFYFLKFSKLWLLVEKTITLSDVALNVCRGYT